MISKDIFKGLFLGLFLSFLISFAYISANKADPKNLTLKISGPSGTGSIDLAITGSETSFDYLDILDKLFSKDKKNELMREGAINWLAKTQSLFSIESQALALALKTSACEPFPEGPPQLRLDKRQECADKPALNALRRLAFSGKVPFHQVGNKERVGIQGDNRRKPNSGEAYVCNNSHYANKKIVVTAFNNVELTKTFSAISAYPCPDSNDSPALQMNPEDAKELFGPKLLKHNFAIVYIDK